MKLPNGLGRLAYNLGAHPHRTWAEARNALGGPVAAVKARVSPDAPMAIGLRLSECATEELAAPEARAELASILRAGGLRAITATGFPYGPSHPGETGARLNAARGLDWRSELRVADTVALAELLAAVNPSGAFLSLSIVPGAFRPAEENERAAVAENLLRAVSHLVDLEAKTGRRVALALEPEPFCFLETIPETIGFFRDHLFNDAAAARLAALTGLTAMAAMKALPRHIGLCYDACHAAVEFEDAATSIARLRAAKLPIHKLQLSTALSVASGDDAARRALAALISPERRRQVVAKGACGVVRFPDIENAVARGGAPEGAEWRMHVHAPAAADVAPPFQRTGRFLAEILEIHRNAPIADHVELEAFTIGAAAPRAQDVPLDAAIANDLAWVTARLA